MSLAVVVRLTDAVVTNVVADAVSVRLAAAAGATVRLSAVGVVTVEPSAAFNVVAPLLYAVSLPPVPASARSRPRR